MTAERPTHPGVQIKEHFLDPLDITARQLADDIGLPLPEIDALLAGQAAISPEIAMRLGLFFDVPALWWLEMQARYDAADQGRLEALRQSVRRYGGLGQVLVMPSGVRRFAIRPAASPASNTLSVTVPEAFVERLRAQAALADPRPERQPEVIYFEDGTPCLTGR
jgi:addiction module HigA family antidote